MTEYLFSHQEGLDLFALLPKRLKRINGVPVDEWLAAHEHRERTCRPVSTDWVGNPLTTPGGLQLNSVTTAYQNSAQIAEER